MKKILYAVVFLIMAVTFDLVWRKVADFAFSYEFTDGLTAYSYHNFSKQADVLVLGSSGGRYHINTDIMKDSLKTSCYNLSMDACGMYQQYASLKRCYENGPISTVIIDLTPMQMGHPINGEFTNITYFTPYYWKDSELKDVMDRAYGRKYTLRYLSSFVQFNGLFIDIVVRIKNFRTKVHTTKSGFLPLEEIDSSAYNGEDDVLNFSPNPICLELLEKIVRMCDHNASRLIVVLSPAQANLSCFTNWVSSYCSDNRIELYDYTTDSRFKNGKYFRDGVHLNGSGANYFTRCPIEDLKLSNGYR